MENVNKKLHHTRTTSQEELKTQNRVENLTKDEDSNTYNKTATSGTSVIQNDLLKRDISTPIVKAEDLTKELDKTFNDTSLFNKTDFAKLSQQFITLVAEIVGNNNQDKRYTTEEYRNNSFHQGVSQSQLTLKSENDETFKDLLTTTGALSVIALSSLLSKKGCDNIDEEDEECMAYEENALSSNTVVEKICKNYLKLLDNRNDVSENDKKMYQNATHQVIELEKEVTAGDVTKLIVFLVSLLFVWLAYAK